MNEIQFYERYGKRPIDVLFAISGLVILSPVILMVAILLIVSQGSPVFFRQVRPGRNSEFFTMIKFRTMNNNRSESGRLQTDAQRLTRIGRFIRRTSLDELPELWNVLCGSMSIVGPRPLLPDYLGNYTKEQARRHDVRPGITGLAQVQGRQTIPFSERLIYDVSYVDNISFILDAKIFFKTIVQVFATRGVILGQDVRAVDDIGLAGKSTNRRLPAGDELNDN